MIVAETEPAFLRADPAGVWRFRGWAPAWVEAGVVDRAGDATRLAEALPSGSRLVEAEPVHGSSIAIIERSREMTAPIPACDALITRTGGIALLIRTADCLPLFITDPSRGIVGIAHAGWRGLAGDLPLRLLAALRHAYQSRPETLRVAIGPCIRACCYTVGPEFALRFPSFVQLRDGQRYCDLAGVALEQLQRGGVRPNRVLDSQRCTSCEAQHWFSTRREGQGTGRFTSFIMIRRGSP